MKSRIVNTKRLKVLNAYAGMGGNRKLWENVEVTAIENDSIIAAEYKAQFPDDQVIIGDAHHYIMEHYDEFEFVWSSIPCQTHTDNNNFLHYQDKRTYPHWKLWQEIIYLEKWTRGKNIKYCIENVNPYYREFISPTFKIGRHYFWSNFHVPNQVYKSPFSITNAKPKQRVTAKAHRKRMLEYLGMDLKTDLKGLKHPNQVINNCLHPKIGLKIFEHAFIKEQDSLEAWL